MLKLVRSHWFATGTEQGTEHSKFDSCYLFFTQQAFPIRQKARQGNPKRGERRQIMFKASAFKATHCIPTADLWINALFLAVSKARLNRSWSNLNTWKCQGGRDDL